MSAELVEALRHQRHRFQNHLQVISGWLQLGKPERASAYLATLRQSREQEGRLFGLADWRLLALLLGKHAMAEANGVEVIWDVEAPMQGASQELASWLAARFDAALDVCMAAGEGSRLHVILRESDGQHQVLISCYNAGGEPAAAPGDDWQRAFVPAPEQEP